MRSQKKKYRMQKLIVIQRLPVGRKPLENLRKRNKAAGCFEGEMANKLETYIDDAKEENDKGIEKAAELVTELGTQIDKINEKISFLNNSIDYKRSLI